MIILRYDAKSGIPFRDGEVEEYVANLAQYIQESNLDLLFVVATENIINAVRLGVKEGRLPIQAVRMEYLPTDATEPLVLEIGTDGNIAPWLAGYCDTNERYIARIIEWDTIG